MRATYLFLVSEGDVEGDASPWDVWHEQVDHYMERKGDENNWYTLLAGVNYDNNTHFYDEESSHVKAAKDVTFDNAMCLAMRCVAADVHLGGQPFLSFPGVERTDEEKRIDNMSYEALLQEVISQVLAALSWEFSTMATQTWGQIMSKPMFDYKHKDLGLHQLKRMVMCTLGLLESCVPPFTQSRYTPYEYRCFDLRNTDYNSTNLTNCAIIYVDIHT